MKVMATVLRKHYETSDFIRAFVHTKRASQNFDFDELRSGQFVTSTLKVRERYSNGIHSERTDAIMTTFSIFIISGQGPISDQLR